MMGQTLETGVLVIGGGAAGLRAALAAAEAGADVLLVNKGPIARSGITLAAAGGMQAPFHSDDSAEQYFQDTLRCGYDLGDPNLARLLAEGACRAVTDLERFGAKFVRRDDGQYSLGKFPGQSHPRNLFVKGGGIGMAAALAKACKARDNIRMIDDFFVTGLVQGTSAGSRAVAGAMGLRLHTGEVTMIRARSVVLAIGGCQWLWEVNDCPTDATGEGLMAAFRAGATLVDMEMVLFYPSVIVWPPSLKGAFVHYEFLAESILDGNVYDRDGRPVLTKPLPVRDQAMRELDRAIREGRGGEHGGLFWYVGDSPKGGETVRKKLDIAQYNYLKQHGVDPATAKIEVAPGAHYLLGGVRIDAQCRTSVAGLFATPECAGNFDGANRLAGSGLTATQVFGTRAGQAAQEWAAGAGPVEPAPDSVEQEADRIARRIHAPGAGEFREFSLGIGTLRRRLRAAVQQYAGVSRDRPGLMRLQQETEEIQKELAGMRVPAHNIYPQALVDLLQLEAMCETAEVIAGSALLRTESRGHHFRTDFPAQDEEQWRRHTCAERREGRPRFGVQPIAGK